MADTFKVAAVQMNCVLGELGENLNTAEKMIRDGASQGASLLVVPELFDTGYRTEEKDKIIAGAIPGPTTNRICKLCKELNIYVIGTTLEKTNEKPFDTAFLAGPQGLVGIYHKNALWDKENERFKKGNFEHPVFDIGFCKVGIQICYEIGFPEGARILTLQGADVIAYPSAFGISRLYAWDLASRSRALENGNYVIACNRSGTEKGETTFAGNSRIINSRGDIIVQAVDDNQVIIAEVDLNLAKKQREAIPYLKDLNRAAIASYYLE